MELLVKNKIIPLARVLFFEKQGYNKEQLIIEASGPYSLEENQECFVLRNMDCCKAIMVTVSVKNGITSMKGSGASPNG